MTSRRGAGEGSVYFDDRKALWVGVINLPPDDAGRRRRKYVRAKRKQDLLTKMASARSELSRGLPLPDKTRSTADYLVWWYTEILPGRVKERTAKDYIWIIDHYIIPAIGKHRLATLDPEHIDAMLRAMESRGLAPRTRRLTRTVLRGALKTADRYGYVSRNAAALTEPPAIGSAKVEDSLTAVEAIAVLKFVSTDRFAALAEIVLKLGLRKGEVLALRWDDIDFEHNTLTVRGTLKARKGGGWYIDVPKTAHSARTLPLIASVRALLIERQELQRAERDAGGEQWQEFGFVFTTRNGTPVNEWNAWRWWQRVTVGAGIGPRRFHATRHTTATLLHEAGVPLEVISALLGHSSLAITADVYASIGLKAKRDAANKIGEALRSADSHRPGNNTTPGRQDDADDVTG